VCATRGRTSWSSHAHTDLRSLCVCVCARVCVLGCVCVQDDLQKMSLARGMTVSE
jgi:hypothetical protein